MTHCRFTWPRLVCVALAVFGLAGAVHAAEKPELEIQTDIEYGTGAGEPLMLDIASPKGLDHPVPAIVVIHGGGWRQGKRQDVTAIMKRAAAHGYVACTISYRLAPKHRFPAQIEDAKCAVRYLRANADKLNIDPQRIGAIGSSAGAHLAMMLGTLDSPDGMEGEGGHPDEASKVQAVVSFVGPVNLVRTTYTDAQKATLSDFFGGNPHNKQADCRRASPLNYVNNGDAPMLCFFGTKDTLVTPDQAYEISEAMTEAGVPGRIELLVGAQHGWLGDEVDRTLDASFEFFDQYLKK